MYTGAIELGVVMAAILYLVQTLLVFEKMPLNFRTMCMVRAFTEETWRGTELIRQCLWTVLVVQRVAGLGTGCFFVLQAAVLQISCDI